MTEIELKTEDVCRILEACAKNGVTEIKLGTLVARFDRPVKAPEQALVAAPAQVSAEQAKIEEEAHLKNELSFREEQLAELRLTNPKLYEELVASGELTDDDDDSESTDGAGE